MSTMIVHGRHVGVTPDTQVAERNSHRLYGWVIAIASSVVLWSAIGGIAWGVASFFN